MPAGFYEDFAGQSRLEINEGNTTLIAFGLAIIIIYLVLAAQFESFRDPLIIMLTVPLSIFGALVPLNIGLSTLNIYTQVGLITLIGLITKHGILMVQFANAQRELGHPKFAAIVEAARVRLRPILMTTAAMVVGVVPLIIASGAGAKARFSIGLVIAAGMAIGTLFTLFVLPMFYTFIARSDVVHPHPEDRRCRACSGGVVGAISRQSVLSARNARRAEKQRLHRLEVMAHARSRLRKVALLDRLNDCRMLGEAVMIGRRMWGIIAKPSPHDSSAHGIDSVEDGEQQRVMTRRGDGPVQAVVPILILPPGLRAARTAHAELHLGDIAGGRVQRRLARQLRLDSEPRAHHLARVGLSCNLGDRRHFGDRARADERALPHMPPQFAMLLHDGRALSGDRHATRRGVLKALAPAAAGLRAEAPSAPGRREAGVSAASPRSPPFCGSATSACCVVNWSTEAICPNPLDESGSLF